MRWLLLVWLLDGCDRDAPRAVPQERTGMPASMPSMPRATLSRRGTAVRLPDCRPSWRLLAATHTILVVQPLGPAPPPTGPMREGEVPIRASHFRARIIGVLSEAQPSTRGEIVILRPHGRPGSPGRDRDPTPDVDEIERLFTTGSGELILIGDDGITLPQRWRLCTEAGCVLPATPEMRVALGRELAAQRADARTPLAPDGAANADAARLADPAQATAAMQALLDRDVAAVPALLPQLRNTGTVPFNRIEILDASGGSGRQYSIGSVHGPGTVGEAARSLLEEITGERCPCRSDALRECDLQGAECIAFWTMIAAKLDRQRTGRPVSECALPGHRQSVGAR